MATLLDKLAGYRPFRAIVVGDFILDQHLYGAAERLSPDAPVPVLHASRSEDRPGGAANVALCLGGLKSSASASSGTIPKAICCDRRSPSKAVRCTGS